jgi:hypothetical protein
MGNGNPEVADAVIARESKVFIADKLSLTNISQLNHLNVSWVQLRDDNGFKRFKRVLEELEIPHTDLDVNLEIEVELNRIFDEIIP